MRRHRVLAVCSAVALSIGVVAPAAQAYDREAYEYAAGHMIDRSDIPKDLGSLDPALQFLAGGSSRTSICFVPSGTEGEPGTSVYAPKAKLIFTGIYSSGRDDFQSVQVQVLEYGTSTAAIKAFGATKVQAKKCDGTGSSTFTDNDGTAYTSSWAVSNATVPMDTVTGVESISITQNNLSTSTSASSKYLNDSYSVLSLVGSVIILTNYYMDGTKNITSAQRKSVDRVAFAAIGRWVD